MLSNKTLTGQTLPHKFDKFRPYSSDLAALMTNPEVYCLQFVALSCYNDAVININIF